MREIILALNAGSSSIKFGIYAAETSPQPAALAKGTLDVSNEPRLCAHAPDGKSLADQAVSEQGLDAGVVALLNWSETTFATRIAACGHRIVHGGRFFIDPIVLTRNNIDDVEALTPLAPLHQPRSIAPIQALMRVREGLPQVGCFDTAFHRTMTAPANRFALPREFEERGIRRYGFHGLSYEYIAERLKTEGSGPKRIIVAHLGNGASLCALQDGHSVDTTMGFSALDGLMMGTRCGSIDPGLLIYLMQHEGISASALEDLLYTKSGLLGVSGVASDMRQLEASTDTR
ncbi:MAG TPA: acetate kinase, partial [Tianweitania sediminis]|nr:acetate kinase [Tianweitania sediminis]